MLQTRAACYNLVATSQPPKQVTRPLYIGDVTTLQPVNRFFLYTRREKPTLTEGTVMS